MLIAKDRRFWSADANGDFSTQSLRLLTKNNLFFLKTSKEDNSRCFLYSHMVHSASQKRKSNQQQGGAS
ncbi:hypothetical protein HanIR_Chr11g0517131 [Helianthus annuus]|nr:hypothetical protein HanIR_Chr11g0517131 [Helianthus annuus]